MRKVLLAGALVCAGAGLVWCVFLSHPSARRQPAASAERKSEIGEQRSEPSSDLRSPTSDLRPLPPTTILENMRTTIRQYGSMFGGNPVGTNPEITRALNGDNPKQVKFLRAEDGTQINAKGELVDPWSTPYFFHQISGTEMEIRSAGPDKIMWTTDDLVTR